MLPKNSVRWLQKITNEEIIKRMGIRRNIIQRIKDRKSNLFGHICRKEDNRLMKGWCSARWKRKEQEEDHAKNGGMI